MLPPHVPQLDASRIRLRPWRLDDAPVVQAVANDPYIPLITTVSRSGTLGDAEAFIRRQQGRLGEGAGYAFAIALGNNDEAIGHIGLWTRHLDEGRATAGYWLVPAQRGRGYATEALTTVRDWAMMHVEVTRLDMFVEPWNTASRRAAEAAGFEHEGVLRNWQRIDGQPTDMEVWAVTRRARHSSSGSRV